MSPLSRDKQALSVAGWLGDGVSVHVVGPVGAGKTTLLHNVRSQLTAADGNPLMVRGQKALSSTPLGALVAAGLAPAGAPANSAIALGQTVGEDLSSRHGTFLVDDAEWLDDYSARVLAVAQRISGTAIAYTSRGSTPTSGAVEILRELDGLQVREALEPMRFDQLNAFTSRLLGGAVDPILVANIARLSGGLPGAVQAIVTVARHTGQISLRNGVWVAPGDVWNPALDSFAARYLEGTTEEQLAILRDIAVRGTPTHGGDLEPAQADALATLISSGIVREMGSASEREYLLHPRLVRELLARRSPQVPVDNSAWSEAKAFPQTTPHKSFAARLTRASLDTIVERLMSNTRTNLQERQNACERTPSPESTVHLLHAFNLADAPVDVIRNVLERANAQPEPGLAATRIAVIGTTLVGLKTWSLPTARNLALQLDALQPETGALDAALAHIEFLVERVPDVEATSRMSAYVGPTIAAIGVEAALARGECHTARHGLSAAVDGYGELERHNEIMTGLTYVLDGKLDLAAEHASGHLERIASACDEPGMCGHAYVAGLALMLSGRFEEFERVSELVLAMPVTPIFERHYRSGLLALAAIVAALRGRTGYARQLGDQILATSSIDGPFPGMVSGGLLALAQNVADPAGVGEALWAGALERAELGYISAACMHAAVAAELLPSTEYADKLARLTDNLASPLAAAWRDYVIALAAGDTTQLDLVRSEFEHMGCDLFAVRCRIAVASIAFSKDDRAGAADLAMLAWVDSQRFGSERSGLFANLVNQVALSTREHEIARLVATGLSTPEIARLLTVSSRTVESHVQSTYRKLGIDSREALTACATTWLVEGSSRRSNAGAA